MKVLIIISLLMLITSCTMFDREKVYITKIKKIYIIPTKLSKIEPPKLFYLSDKSYCNTKNIDVTTKMLLEISDYAKKLNKKIKKYENDIDKLKKERK